MKGCRMVLENEKLGDFHNLRITEFEKLLITLIFSNFFF